MKESYWDNESDIYQYSRSVVLKNRAEIREQVLLDSFEQRTTALRVDEVIPAISGDPIDLAL